MINSHSNKDSLKISCETTRTGAGEQVVPKNFQIDVQKRGNHVLLQKPAYGYGNSKMVCSPYIEF